jgi:hypothetical protein
VLLAIIPIDPCRMASSLLISSSRVRLATLSKMTAVLKLARSNLSVVSRIVGSPSENVVGPLRAVEISSAACRSNLLRPHAPAWVPYPPAKLPDLLYLVAR